MREESKTVQTVYSQEGQPQVEGEAGQRSEENPVFRIRLRGFPGEQAGEQCYKEEKTVYKASIIIIIIMIHFQDYFYISE